MFKKIGIVFLALILIVSCGGNKVQKTGSDLSLTTSIAINDLPELGPIKLKQTQMFSGNVMRSVISTDVQVGGEAQEISSTFIVNLDDGNMYFINDIDKSFVQMNFAEFDSLMNATGQKRDSNMAALSLTKRDIKRDDQGKKVIGQFGECVPVDFDMVLEAGKEDLPYQSSLKGEMWMSEAIANADLFMNFQKKANDMFGQTIGAGSSFFGLAGMVNLDENWLEELSSSLTGIPVKAEFKINIPSGDKPVTYGISLNLEEYSTEDIDAVLMTVPEGYKKVDFSEFRMY